MSEIDYLTPEQSVKLVNDIKNIKHKTIVSILLDAGLRVSECVNLKLSDFDFKRRLLIVNSLKKRSKNKKRTIPISDRLYNVLADYIYSNKNINNQTYLFEYNSKPLTRFAVSKLLSRYKAKNPEFHNLHPHTLRHTFATLLLAAHTDLVYIKEMLGHEKYDTTLIYAHTPTEIIREKINQLAHKQEKSFFQRLFSFNAEKPRTINISNTAINFLIGRKELLEKVNSYISRNINVILIGPIGIGKSSILSNLAIPANKKVFKVDDITAFKNTLINAILFLFENDKEAVFNLMYPTLTLENAKVHLSRHSLANLAKELIKLTEKHEYIVQIDNIDGITPKTVKIIEILREHFIIVTSAREIPIRLTSLLWNFETVKITPLSRLESIELIYKLSSDLHLEDEILFRNHIYDQSAGNPRIIVQLVERYRKEPFLTNEIIKNIKHFGGLPEIDMSLLVLIGLGSLAILRYLASETDDKSLRFIGGTALILLIIFRNVFRLTKLNSIK
jgi:hypothetical protein